MDKGIGVLIMVKKICLILIFLIIILFFIIDSYAVTAPSLMITTTNYSYAIDFNEIKDIEVGQRLQLYALIVFGNEGLRKHSIRMVCF